MASTGAAQMMLHVFNGSISMQDMEIERRPYHKNCGCALHNLKAICPNFCPLQRLVSFPNKTSFLSQASISATLSKSSPSQTTVFKGYTRIYSFVSFISSPNHSLVGITLPQ